MRRCATLLMRIATGQSRSVRAPWPSGPSGFRRRMMLRRTTMSAAVSTSVHWRRTPSIIFDRCCSRASTRCMAGSARLPSFHIRTRCCSRFHSPAMATAIWVALRRARSSIMRSLWDPSAGGFYRYADSADWSQPGTGKTLEDNAALLHVYVEAALRLRDVRNGSNRLPPSSAG